MIQFSSTVTCQYDTIFSPFSADEFLSSLKWLTTSQFDAAEICISHYKNIDVEILKDTLDSYHLGCSTISTGQARGLENISLTHENPDFRQKAIKRIQEHIDAAKILGSKVTVGLLRGSGDSAHAASQLELLKKSLDICLNYASKQNVTIILEAINRYETCLLNSAESTLNFIHSMGNPDCLGILWDVFHANIEDKSFSCAIDQMGSFLKHVHLADSNRYFPGYGHIDFNSIYQKLLKSDYDGYLSFECLNLPSKEIVRSEAGKFIKTLRTQQ
jgi:sugar phosphate isomerase/epimerase